MLEGSDSLNAVLFVQPSLGQQPDAADVWPMLFDGEKPDAFQRTPGMPLPVTTASGQRDGANVQITAQVGRIDLVWTRSPIDETGRPGQFADISGAINIAASALGRLTDGIEPARLGLAINTSSKIGNADPAAALSSLLERVYFPPTASDAIYRVNLQRDLPGMEEAKLNRLSTWLTGAHQMFSLNPGTPFPVVMETISYMAHNVDVNTIGQLTFDRMKPRDLIDVIKTEAIEVLSQGLRFYG